jgi:hypothetical protein
MGVAKILSVLFLIAYTSSATLPTTNPYLANSYWPTSHQNSYCTDSSSSPGPELSDVGSFSVDLLAQFLHTLDQVTLVYTEDNSVLWGSSVTDIIKIDRTGEKMAIIGTYKKRHVLEDWQFHGAYPSLSNNGTFYVSTKDKVSAYGDEEPGNSSSGISFLGDFQITDFASDEYIVGLTMSYDGWLIWGSNQGRLGAVHNSLTKASDVLELPGYSEGVSISNSFAVDEFGHVYIVSDVYMQEVLWDGSQLQLSWAFNYNNDTTTRYPGRLGIGSGSTPTIMSTGGQRYVVITDGMSPMHILFFDTNSGDLVANETVIFDATNQSTSEQSVVVHDNRAVVVNNWYGNVSCPEFLYKLAPVFMEEMCPIFKGVAPPGVRQFEINPETNEVKSTWVNTGVSCPNGIPTMSSSSNLFYCIGKREHIGWTLEALNWDNGESVFYVDLGFGWDYNSNYAATEIGPNKEVISGTMFGIVRISVSS